VDPGRTTHSARPVYWRRQSVKYGLVSSAAVSTCDVPTILPNASITLGF
jgi:hypothetical protein